jgi:hypothetical protein
VTVLTVDYDFEALGGGSSSRRMVRAVYHISRNNVLEKSVLAYQILNSH